MDELKKLFSQERTSVERFVKFKINVKEDAEDILQEVATTLRSIVKHTIQFALLILMLTMMAFFLYLLIIRTGIEAAVSSLIIY